MVSSFSLRMRWLVSCKSWTIPLISRQHRTLSFNLWRCVRPRVNKLTPRTIHRTLAGTVAVWVNVTTRADILALLVMAVRGHPLGPQVVLVESHVHLARRTPRLTRRNASEARP